MSEHTPGPWEADNDGITSVIYAADRSVVVSVTWAGGKQDANARLIAAAPELLAALVSVRSLISEAAMTGFNCQDGDWAERLFASQQVTTRAIAKAEGR